MSVKPTIALVPGSFSRTAAYDKLVEQLSKHAYPTIRIELKSVGGPEPATSLDDAAHINSVLTPLVDSGKHVVVVMHSYGGIPGTDGTTGLAKADREAANAPGGVIGLVYVAAMLVEPGASLGSTRSDMGPLPEWVTMEGAFMRLDPLIAARETLSDLPASEAEMWAHIFDTHSAASFGTELQYPAYRHIPSTYILAENDRILLPEEQYRMVEAARLDNPMPLRLVKLQSGHAPIVTQADKMADAIREAAGEVF